MTVKELARNWILCADETPGEIDLATARVYVDSMDPGEGVPESLTPEAFMAAWNDLIRFGDSGAWL